MTLMVEMAAPQQLMGSSVTTDVWGWLPIETVNAINWRRGCGEEV